MCVCYDNIINPMKLNFNIKNKSGFTRTPKFGVTPKWDGFTLIELLVVVAIIGILASVVLASLNSARDKGKAAAIKSNLKNMISQAELAYDTPGNYSTVCTDSKITSMLTAITNAGATTSCLSYNNSGLSDVYLRFGATGIIYSATPPVKAWSVSNIGAVTWDAQGVNSAGAFVGTDVTMTWDQANTACATAGGRLPTMEELKTLTNATFAAGATYTPPGFVASHYWSSVTVPSSPTYAYIVTMTTGDISYNHKANGSYVRCVR